MSKLSVSIAGCSGYTGGELLRLLLSHPGAEIKQVTSERFNGKAVTKLHPNLRKNTGLKFTSLNELEYCDTLFLCLPHKSSSTRISEFMHKADRLIDLSGDFRLRDAAEYKKWYGTDHPAKEYLEKFVYGIPELHREEMKTARFISSAGCNATASILGLYPLFKNDLAESGSTVIEVKVGSSESGNESNPGSHHPERSNCVRSFMPTGHRHTAEIIQELNFGKDIKVSFSATSIDMVRGVLATCHVFLNKDMDEKDIWKVFRKEYSNEPFIRIVKENDGIYRYPEPKLLWGTNYCDIGFEKDKHSNRLVVISAIDNLMKGAAGQALQAFNIMNGFEETEGLEFTGLHPV